MCDHNGELDLIARNFYIIIKNNLYVKNLHSTSLVNRLLRSIKIKYETVSIFDNELVVVRYNDSNLYKVNFKFNHEVEAHINLTDSRDGTD